MENLSLVQNDLVFGLDIGTRNIVGVVGYQDNKGFHVVAMAKQEHETRAMIDGQIHDIYKVGDTIRRVKNELEKQLEMTLSDVCIAAAGRVLKTINSSSEYSFEEETRVTQEHIYSLNLMAVEKAHGIINDNSSQIRFYCVGNTPVSYKLNGFEISNLEGHKADSIGVELIATFLPEDVVDGLYEAVEYAGLRVASLTLEPIAAMNVAIPEQYRLLNIGLIDVGAGTSDICLTKDGSVMAYGMIALAGDEITEVIARSYLVDFNTAEKIKLAASDKKEGLVTFFDIMGLEQNVEARDIIQSAADVVDNMAKETADKIIELNGGKSVSAVFVVGGGGKIVGYTEKVAEYLKLPKERVAVRGKEVLTNVEFRVGDFEKDSLYVTPVGICTNYYTQKNNFIFVTVNSERIKLYDNDKLTVVDAIMQVGYPNEKIFPRHGKELSFSVNGKSRLVRGMAGEGAVVKLNGRVTTLHTPISQNDIITIEESTFGEAAHMTIGQLDEFKGTIEFNVNGKNVVCPKFAYVNNELKSEYYEIQSGDNIRMENYYTVRQLFEFLDYDTVGFDVYVNNELAEQSTLVYENFKVRTSAITQEKYSADSFEYYDKLARQEEEASDTADVTEETAQETDRQAAAQIDGADLLQSEKVNDNEAAAPQAGSMNVGKAEAPQAGSMNVGKAEAPQAGSVNGNEAAAPRTEEAIDKQELHKENENVIESQPKVIHSITIIINNTPVKLSGKTDYVLVDLFQFYNFDLSKSKGNIVLKLNGVEGNYMAPIKDGDVVDLYWEEVRR